MADDNDLKTTDGTSVKLQKIIKLKNIIKQVETFTSLVEKENNNDDHSVVTALQVVTAVLGSQVEKYNLDEKNNEQKKVLLEKVNKYFSMETSEEEKSMYVKFLLKQIKIDLEKDLK